MTRTLFLFEEQDPLGQFRTGAYGPSDEALLVRPRMMHRNESDRIVFAVLGNKTLVLTNNEAELIHGIWGG